MCLKANFYPILTAFVFHSSKTSPHSFELYPICWYSSNEESNNTMPIEIAPSSSFFMIKHVVAFVGNDVEIMVLPVIKDSPLPVISLLSLESWTIVLLVVRGFGLSKVWSTLSGIYWGNFYTFMIAVYLFSLGSKLSYILCYEVWNYLWFWKTY